MTTVKTNLTTKESARKTRFEPNGTIDATNVQDAIEEVAAEASGASAALTYITVSNEASLSNERRLAAGTGLGLTDGGAGSTITLALTDAELLAIAGLVSAADKLPYFTGSGTASLADLTASGRAIIAAASAAAQTALLSAFTGDSGSGGVKGLVPAPASGDAAAGKFLKADGTWAAASASGAPADAQYITLATNATLTVERVITAGSGISLTDGGAGSTLTVAISDAELLAIAGLTSAADRLPYFTGSGTAALATFTSAARSLLDDADAATMLATLGAAGQGKQTIWIPASACVARATNGAGTTTYDSGSNDVTIYTYDFDTTTQEYIHTLPIGMPKSWNESTVTAIVYWTNTGGSSTQTVRFTVAGLAVSDDDTINGTFGTAVNLDDTWLAQNDLHITAESSAITIGGTPAENDMCIFQISRDVANDNMSGDARFIGLKLFITTNAATDA